MAMIVLLSLNTHMVVFSEVWNGIGHGDVVPLYQF